MGALLLAAPDLINSRSLDLSDYGNTPPPPPPPPPEGGYQPGYGSAPSGPPLAAWIQRVGAFLLDQLLTLPLLIPYYIFLPKTTTTVGSDGTPDMTVSGGSFPIVFLILLLMVAISGYNRWYKGGQGQSFGKKQLGLTLLGESTGQPIGTAKAFLRDLAHFVDSIICYIGYLFPLWDPKRQTLADKIMTTVVTSKA